MNFDAEILGLEKQLLDSGKRHSEDFLREILSEEFVEIGSSGKTYNREDTIKELLNSKDFEYEISDFKTIELGNDIVLASYKIKINGKLSFRNSLWKKSGDKWKIVYHRGKNI
ncbi:MAG: DUF4440 domain-containing protein [Ignavibacteria bacterium]|nr:DUF4440 domain-containing protein [Ignavibacteria bacterium]